MRIYKFLTSGGSLWDNTMTYPESITSGVRAQVETNVKLKFSFHKIRNSLIGLADDMNVELTDLIPEVINNLMISNSYKYDTLFATTNLSYNPIENYRMTETENVDRDTDITRSDTETHNLSDSETRNLTDTTTHADSDTLTLNTTKGVTHGGSSRDITTTETSNTETKSLYGFNSDAWNNADKTVNSGNDTITKNVTDDFTDGETRTGTETTAHTGTVTDQHTGTDTTLHTGTVGNSGTENTDEIIERSLTRAGNIGVTTSQQMIESEREVALFSFIDVVVNDIINELCITVI